VDHGRIIVFCSQTGKGLRDIPGGIGRAVPIDQRCAPMKLVKDGSDWTDISGQRHYGGDGPDWARQYREIRFLNSRYWCEK
jgi:hypothetical protein